MNGSAFQMGSEDVLVHVTPMQLLAVMLILTVAARIAFVVLRRRQRRTLQKLAREWRMHYSARDNFHLADGVAARIGIPAAADLRVADLIYGTERGDIAHAGAERDFYRFVFSAEFTLGVTQAKRRVRRVLTFREPKGQSDRSQWSPITIAPEDLPLLEQYAALKREIDVREELKIKHET